MTSKIGVAKPGASDLKSWQILKTNRDRGEGPGSQRENIPDDRMDALIINTDKTGGSKTTMHRGETISSSLGITRIKQRRSNCQLINYIFVALPIIIGPISYLVFAATGISRIHIGYSIVERCLIVK